MAQGYTTIIHEHCNIKTTINLIYDECFWNCNKCGLQFKAVRISDGRILISPYIANFGDKEYKKGDSVHLNNEIKVRVSSKEIYTLGEFRLREKLFRQGIKFDINTVRYADPNSDDIVFIQKVPSLGIDFTRYEKYLQWFMDKFIIDKKETIEELMYTTATQIKYSQRKDSIQSMLYLYKLCDKIMRGL